MLDIFADTRRPSILAQDMIQRAVSGYRYSPDKAPTIGELPLMATKAVRRWLRRRNTEVELCNLSDHMLEDIGIARWDIARIARESAKHAAPLAAAKINDLKTEITALVDSTQAPVSGVANDDAKVRAA